MSGYLPVLIRRIVSFAKRISTFIARVRNTCKDSNSERKVFDGGLIKRGSILDEQLDATIGKEEDKLHCLHYDLCN